MWAWKCRKSVTHYFVWCVQKCPFCSPVPFLNARETIMEHPAQQTMHRLSHESTLMGHQPSADPALPPFLWKCNVVNLQKLRETGLVELWREVKIMGHHTSYLRYHSWKMKNFERDDRNANKIKTEWHTDRWPIENEWCCHHNILTEEGPGLWAGLQQFKRQDERKMDG